MQNPSEKGPVFQVRSLPQNQAQPFEVRPTKAELAVIAADFGLIGLRKTSLIGTIQAEGKTDWTLKARLGATVVQPCVVTLDPVTTRLEATVERHYLAEVPDQPDDEEVEMPEDENAERLGSEIDVSAVLYEALALNLPQFPRANNAEMENAVFTEPGKQAMTDQEARPFASLAALRNKLGSAEDE